MAPFELKGLTAKQLGEIRNAMADLTYILEVEKLPLEKRKESAWIHSQVQSTYLKIRQTELSAIRDLLIANETDLTTGIGQVQIVLADLKKTEEIMSQVTGFLKIVGRIVTII
jgi:hypothetical protein